MNFLNQALKFSILLSMLLLFIAPIAIADTEWHIVPVGDHPQGLAVSSDSSKVYVANSYDDTVSVINTTTFTVVRTIPVGESPLGVEIRQSDGNYVYVANYGDNSVTVIRIADQEIIKTISVGRGPVDINCDNQGFIYVSNYLDDTVTKINSYQNNVVGTIPVGNGPRGLMTVVVDTDNFLYVCNSEADTVSKINLADLSLEATITVGNGPTEIAAKEPVNDFVYVTNRLANTISVINTDTNAVTTISTGIRSTPYGIQVSKSTESLPSYIYVSNQNDNSVTVLDADTNTVLYHINLSGNNPAFMDLAPNEGYLYVSNVGSDNVSIIRRDQPCIVEVSDGTGPPGSYDNPVYISVDNPVPIAIAKFTLGYNINQDFPIITSATADTMGRAEDFTVQFLDSNDSIEMVISSYSGVIPAGSGPIVVVYFDISDTTEIYDQTLLMLDPENSELQDPNFEIIEADFTDTGTFTVDCEHDGDLNNNGQVDIGDVTKCINFILGVQNPSPAEKCIADMNADGYITIADVQCMINTILGLPCW